MRREPQRRRVGELGERPTGAGLEAGRQVPSVGERQRRYLVHVPQRYDGRPLPVVLMCHGAGGTAEWTLGETRWDETADRYGFLVVFPEGTPVDPGRPPRFLSNPQVWDDGSGRRGRAQQEDVAFVNALLDDLPAHFAVDAQRVYATGFSLGASFTFRLGVELSHRLAAIVPVASHCWLDDRKPRRPRNPLPYP